MSPRAGENESSHVAALVSIQKVYSYDRSPAELNETANKVDVAFITCPFSHILYISSHYVPHNYVHA